MARKAKTAEERKQLQAMADTWITLAVERERLGGITPAPVKPKAK